MSTPGLFEERHYRVVEGTGGWRLAAELGGPGDVVGLHEAGPVAVEVIPTRYTAFRPAVGEKRVV